MLIENLEQSAGIDQAKLVGLVDDALQIGALEPPGEVYEGADDGCDGDAAIHHHIRRRKVHAAINQHSAAGPGRVRRNRDLDRTVSLPVDPPERRDAAIAQRRSRSTAQDSRHPAPTTTELRPPHGVDTALDRMQPAFLDPVLNCLGAETELE